MPPHRNLLQRPSNVRSKLFLHICLWPYAFGNLPEVFNHIFIQCGIPMRQMESYRVYMSSKLGTSESTANGTIDGRAYTNFRTNTLFFTIISSPPASFMTSTTLFSSLTSIRYACLYLFFSSRPSLFSVLSLFPALYLYFPLGTLFFLWLLANWNLKQCRRRQKVDDIQNENTSSALIHSACLKGQLNVAKRIKPSF